MNKVKIDEFMVKHIQYMRSQDHLSLYGMLNSIIVGSNSDLFNYHSKEILKYFNEFDNKSDDENFMKCLLGYYEIK